MDNCEPSVIEVGDEEEIELAEGLNDGQVAFRFTKGEKDAS